MHICTDTSAVCAQTIWTLNRSSNFLETCRVRPAAMRETTPTSFMCHSPVIHLPKLLGCFDFGLATWSAESSSFNSQIIFEHRFLLQYHASKIISTNRGVLPTQCVCMCACVCVWGTYLWTDWKTTSTDVAKSLLFGLLKWELYFHRQRLGAPRKWSKTFWVPRASPDPQWTSKDQWVVKSPGCLRIGSERHQMRSQHPGRCGLWGLGDQRFSLRGYP